MGEVDEMDKRMKVEVPKWIELVGEKRANIALRMPVESMRPVAKKLELTMPDKPEDVMPKPEDWMMMKFRAISATYLGPDGYWLDFSRPGVLLRSIPLMLPKSMGGTRRRHLKFHRGHSEATQAIIGYINGAEWSEASGDQSAPGINVDVMVDYKICPQECRQLLADPPLVESCSISFYFEWEQSHPDLESWQFWNLIGEEIDGAIVRIMVTEMLAYQHIALVHEGGDTEADKLAQSAERKALSENKGDREMEGLLLSKAQLSTLTALLGISALSTWEELEESVRTLAEANDELREGKQALDVKAKVYEALVTKRRGECQQLVVKLEGECGKGTENLLKLMDLDGLEEFHAEYSAKLEKKFPMKCSKCGGKMERRSSVEEPPAEAKGNEKPINQEAFRIGK